MTKKPLTRRKLLAAAAPLAAVPFVGKLAFEGSAEAGGHSHTSHIHGDDATLLTSRGHATGHAAMIGADAPLSGARTISTRFSIRRPRCPRCPGACASTR